MTEKTYLRLTCVAVLSIAFGLSTHVHADEPAETTGHVPFALALNDGSLIVCTPALDEIPITTAYAELRIPIQKIDTMTCTPSTNIVTLIFVNGDRLQGTCNLDSLTVTSLIGELTVPMASVVSLASTRKKAPVFEDSPARKAACINNLRQMDSAKEQWAMATNQRHGAAVNEAGVNAYIKGNQTPVCPAGGTYTYNTIGQNPECNVPGHTMP